MKTLYEFLLTKKHTEAITEPDNGCTVEEIIKWVESYGVEKREFHVGPGRDNPPKKGKLIYVVGPNRNNDTNEYWVALRNHWGQNIVLKPKDRSFCVLNHEQKFITFEKAVELMIEMINTPNKKITDETL